MTHRSASAYDRNVAFVRSQLKSAACVNHLYVFYVRWNITRA